MAGRMRDGKQIGTPGQCPVRRSRRELLALGLGACAGTLPGPLAHAQSDDRLPTLREGNGQFVTFEPPVLVREMQLRPVKGDAVPLSSFRGRVLVVNFWASWCPPCRTEIPVLERFVKQEQASGARAIAVALDQKGALTVRPFLEELGVKRLPVFLDPDFRIATRSDAATPADPFRLFGLPLSFVLSPGGRNLGYFVGIVDWLSPQAQTFLASAARQA